MLKYLQKYMVVLPIIIVMVASSVMGAATVATSSAPATEQSFELAFTAKSSKQRAKIKCRIVQIGDEPVLHKIMNVIKYDLEFTDQFDADLVHHDKEYETKQIKKLFKEGIDTLVCIKSEKVSKNESVDGKAKVSVKVIPTATAKPSFDKAIVYQADSIVAHGHRLSEELLLALTGDAGPCVSTLAWCEKNKICYGDYAGMQVTEVTGPGRKFGLSWHTQAPILFYSRSTRWNNRLELLNLKTGKTEICISYPGLCMQFAGSPDGSKGVVCLSGGSGSTDLYLYDQKVCNQLGKQTFKQLTKNGGTNVSPCYLPNGDVVFCSDYQGAVPQLYYLDTKNNKTTRLTSGSGYCAAPSYCSLTNSVVFTKSVDRTFQLFKLSLDKLDAAAKTELQLTFSAGDKTEPQFHESGKYIAFVYDVKNGQGNRESQIAIHNCNSGVSRTITTGNGSKGYPAWTKRMFVA